MNFIRIHSSGHTASCTHALGFSRPLSPSLSLAQLSRSLSASPSLLLFSTPPDPRLSAWLNLSTINTLPGAYWINTWFNYLENLHAALIRGGNPMQKLIKVLASCPSGAARDKLNQEENLLVPICWSFKSWGFFFCFSWIFTNVWDCWRVEV